jgi:hypothetical protein
MTRPADPFISVVMPVYNALPFLDDSISSILGQTLRDFEFVILEAALARSVAVLVEKPFTLHLSDAFRLVSLAEKNNTPLLVAQNYRYLRSFRTAKRLVDKDVLGRVSMVVCHYYRPFHMMANRLVTRFSKADRNSTRDLSANAARSTFFNAG